MTYQLQHLLTRSAERHGDKVAVVHGHMRITYEELEIQSTKLARTLIEAGAQQGDRIGIHLSKSVRAVVGIFGVLKAGGVYVPIDAAAPAHRVSYIIENCGIRQLITSCEKLDVLRGSCGSKNAGLDSVVVTDTDLPSELETFGMPRVIPWEAVEEANDLAPHTRRLETDLAYVLYTSGSTGHPKGVMISHRSALTFINWAYECFGINRDDVVSSHAPLHFDLSIFDVFTTIRAGGTIVLVPEHANVFPVLLAKFIADHKITVWYSVPSALILLVNKGNARPLDLATLRLVLFAGEVFPVKYLRKLRAITDARLYNLYGPTETNVCTFYEVKSIAPDRVDPFPIGKAVDNVEVFALDEHGRIIKAGDKGELFVRGPGLMSGYWGDREKTERVLVPNRLQPEFDERVYRTGDVVTLDEDGNYIFIGRNDNMIKSRGYRIELGEIEAVLYTHPKITEVAVIGVPDEQITNRLKAFIVCGVGEALSEKDVEQHCLERLPEYMVPQMLEFRKSLPKTSTGKIDRKALTHACLA